MLPSILSREVRTGIRRFLETTFPSSTPLFDKSIGRFLDEPGKVFKGPYYSLRLPFQPDLSGKQHFGQVTYPYKHPHKHQALAFERLVGDAPKSTLVATGTGSGKTECFLYPLLEHCAKTKGEKGIKALVIYPMNALATDQAKRFASAVHKDPVLRDDVRVGMYVQGDGGMGAMMTPDGVITSREEMKRNPPDILMTNFKMLDYLLIRPDDLAIWQDNTQETLKFIVVDELHTFDGAQATDLGCLLRRLKTRLRTPEKHICCVGTSATIGSEDGEEILLEYAGSMFGESFDSKGSIIREHLLSRMDFIGSAYIKYATLPGKGDADALMPGKYQEGQLEYIRGQYPLWFGQAAPDDIGNNEWRIQLGKQLREHAVLRNLLQFFEQQQKDGKVRRQVSEPELLQELALFSEDLQDEELAFRVLDSLCSLCSYARFQHDGDTGVFPLLKIHAHLWFRELARIVSTVESGPGEEESPKVLFSSELQEKERKRCLPMIHCRDCGTMGWVAIQRSNEEKLTGNLDDIYRAFFGNDPKLRFVLPWEDAVGDGFLPQTLCGNCLHVSSSKVKRCPSCHSTDKLVPVHLHIKTKRLQNRLVADKSCPNCQSLNGITIVGSRSASLCSVALGQSFATRFNDDKQALAFSDNVQDASHRASFFAARTYRTTLRTAMCEYLKHVDPDGTLADFEQGLQEYWLKELGRKDFIGTFLAPNMEWLEDYETLKKTGELDARSNLDKEVSDRLGWEVVSEFGYQSRIGRTLEKTGAAMAILSAKDLEKARGRFSSKLKEEIGGFGSVSDENLDSLLLGMIHRLRTIGGISHKELDTYFEDSGNTYILNYRNWSPGFSAKGRSPSAFTMGQASPKKLERVVSTGTKPSWLQDWVVKNIKGAGELNPEIAASVIEIALWAMVGEGLFLEYAAKNGNRYWLIDKTRLQVSTQVEQLRCNQCGHSISSGSQRDTGVWSKSPCIRDNCTGSYDIAESPEDYFGDLYQTGDVTRIHAEEHTGLIGDKERTWIENRFMDQETPRRTDPNLLSCTPTLEMGIDIGDLSSVLLCSVPPQTANYVQRVGRAGRRDGNAFSLTVANAKAHDLYFYRQPEEMIDGDVKVPGVFFNAPAVLERQFLAYCFDQWVAFSTPTPTLPKGISTALNNVLAPSDPPSGFPYDILSYVKTNRRTLLDGFTQLFKGLLESDSINELERFVIGDHGQQPPIELRVVNRLLAHAKEREDLKKRREDTRKRLRKLNALTARDEAIEQEIEELDRLAKGYTGVIQTIQGAHTLNFFTDEGLLPNYAFPEEGVTLRSIILRKKERIQDDGVGKYSAETIEYQRPAASAIRELAPGSSFYAQHRRLTVDQVNVRLSQPELWNFCDQCAYIERLDTSSSPPKTSCPVCGSALWADNSMKRNMIPMRQVVTTEFDRSSRTHDESDERQPEFFESETCVAIPDSQIEKAYRVKHAAVPFGFEFARQATFRMLNLGNEATGGGGEPTMFAGKERKAKGFKLCPECGKVQGIKKGKKEFEHDIICKNRGKANSEDKLEAFFLYRELTSEALRVLVPTVGGVETGELTSFISALQLGLEKYFNGNIEHLGSCTESRPEPGTSFRRTYLVIYDKVPGGTGYLKELSQDANKFIQVLKDALKELKSCKCKSESELDGCHRCILKNRRSSTTQGTPSRSTAIKILEHILSHEEELEAIPTISSIDINPLIESQLERRFLEFLGTLDGASLTNELIAGKNGYLLSLDGQNWEIEPQVSLSSNDGLRYPTRPDFVLRPVRRGLSKPIAIYLDGYDYHANEENGNNRVAKDVAQREGLRRSGDWLVWSLTWDDLSHTQEQDHWNHPGAEETWGALLKSIQAADVAGDLLSIEQLKFLERTFGYSSWKLLQGFLAKPFSPIWKANAYCLALSMGKLNPVKTEDIDAVFEELQKLEGTPVNLSKSPSAGNPLGFYSSSGDDRWRIACKTSMEALKNRDFNQLYGLVRFDDDTRLERELFVKDWNGLLRLHNLLQFLPGFHFITHRQIAQGFDLDMLEAPPETVAATPARPTGTDSGSSWELDLTLLHEDLHRLARDLEAEGCPEPVCGMEILGEDGTVAGEAELAWEDKKVVILVDEQVVFRNQFESEGWAVCLHTAESPLLHNSLIDLLK